MPKSFQVDCEDCNFMARSHDKNEAGKHAMLHITECHPDMKMSMNEVQKMVKPM